MVRWGFGLLSLTLVVLLITPVAALVLGASLDDLFAAMGDPEVLGAIGMSVACAGAAVAIGLGLGVPAGYLLARDRLPYGRVWQALIDVPLVIPHPVIGIGLLLVFARHRLVGSALREGFGLQVAASAPGIILAMLVVSAPFIVKAARDGLAAVPPRMEWAARSLGASEPVAFFTVSLPLAWRHIRSGALLAWARAISEFGSIVIIAYYPRTAPVLIWDRFSAHGLRAAIAPSVLLVAVCLAIFLILQALDARTRGDRQ